MDGKWIGLLVDHLAKLLTDYAIEATNESKASKEVAKAVKESGGED